MTGRAWALAALLLCGAAALASELPETDRAGQLRIAVYEDHAPFSADGRGVDVDVATAVAEKLGLSPEVVAFKDGESVDDDLRNMIWKGHYLWKGALADVMMHLPVDPDFARKNPQVEILAPYFREQLVVARTESRIPRLETLEVFSREKIGVQFNTIEDDYLRHSFAGLLVDNLVHFGSIPEAAAALRRSEVAAVMGRRSQIEAALAGAGSGFPVAPVATPGLRRSGWDVGMAVKADKPRLAALVAAAVSDLGKDGTLERIFRKRGLTYAAPSRER